MPYVRLEDRKLRTLKLEYNIVGHCNFACEECSHLSPFMRREASGLSGFVADVAALAGVLAVHRFRFLGGEPLLHAGLLDHVEAVRASGIAQEIQICSNGSLIDRVDDRLLRSIDHLVLSWYPDERCDPDELAKLAGRVDAAGRRLTVLNTTHFRRMTVGPPIPDERTISRIFSTCDIAHTAYCQTFLDGRFYLCSRPLYTQPFLDRAGLPSIDFKQVDGIAIHEPDLLGRLQRRYAEKAPLASCRHCLGTSGIKHPWRQLTAKERKTPSAPAFEPSSINLPGMMSRMRQRLIRALRASLLIMPTAAATSAIRLAERAAQLRRRLARRAARAAPPAQRL